MSCFTHLKCLVDSFPSPLARLASGFDHSFRRQGFRFGVLNASSSAIDVRKTFSKSLVYFAVRDQYVVGRLGQGRNSNTSKRSRIIAGDTGAPAYPHPGRASSPLHALGWRGGGIVTEAFGRCRSQGRTARLARGGLRTARWRRTKHHSGRVGLGGGR